MGIIWAGPISGMYGAGKRIRYVGHGESECRHFWTGTIMGVVTFVELVSGNGMECGSS